MHASKIPAWAAALIAGFVGFGIGHWQGESKATELTRKIVMYADLTPQCREMLQNGVDAINEASEAYNNARE